VHSKLRNRLSNGRVIKLVRTYCFLLGKENEDLDDLELMESLIQQELQEEVVSL